MDSILRYFLVILIRLQFGRNEIAQSPILYIAGIATRPPFPTSIAIKITLI